jgi:folate-dependent phosphoribosylglycinamide formyltransferase PurN
MDRMNIAIITSDSFFSYLLISDVVQQRKDNIACIVITPSKIKGKSTWQSVKHVYKKTGWRNLMYKIVANLWVYFAEVLSKFDLVKHSVVPSNLAKKSDINLYYSQDCNDQSTLDYLQEKKIDVILSINVYQRILEPLLNLPKIAAVNNHFGLLPKYRGMAPYIWAMANGEKEFGLSVHHMVLDFDEGKLIKQKKMELAPHDSAMGVYIRGCMVARKMITEAVSELENNPKAGFAQEGKGSYFSMPTRECISNFFANGYQLWRIQDLVTVLRSSIDGVKLT